MIEKQHRKISRESKFINESGSLNEKLFMMMEKICNLSHHRSWDDER